MKKLAILTLSLLSISAIAEEKSYFGYGDLHTMGEYRMVGVGYRGQKGKHALDISGSIFPYRNDAMVSERDYSYFSIYHLKGLYFFFPKEKGFYLGSGLGMINSREIVYRGPTLEQAIGYQGKIYDKGIYFIGIHGITPIFHIGGNMSFPVWPGLNMGIGF